MTALMSENSLPVEVEPLGIDDDDGGGPSPTGRLGNGEFVAVKSLA